MTDARPIRVVLAKPGLDGHDQGAKVVARAMLDAGFDVHYTGLRQTPEQVVQAALRADADVIALSSMAGSHLPFCTRLKPLLEAAGLGDRLWIIGGNLPAQDHDALRALGFKGVFQTGSRLDAICDFIKAHRP
ncbi:MAG: cobalamin-dependent protein [Rubrivivax sp.]|nr:cobalamin-dependent protein [Rubrivivax sp.]MBK7262300.1 cobalamin-dependent protein [Rubrivivax sp.]MBK8528522.1 cobalamin-dependent protein [Rubrivivax sp.]